MEPRIAIIGGGFSGLVTAYLLERWLGIDPDIVLLERSDRLGGRISTRELGNTGIYYDSGAAEFYDIPGGLNPRDVIRSLGLPIREMLATPFFCFEGNVLRCEDDIRAALGAGGFKALAEFWELGTSLRTPSQYVLAGHPPDNDHPWLQLSFSDTLNIIQDPKARQFTRVQVHSDVATEPDLTTGLFGFDNLLIDHPHYVRSMFTIVGGNERLIEALARGVSSRVLLSSEVKAIEAQKDGTYDVVFTQGGMTRRVVADFVLATPPPTQLAGIAWSPSTLATAVKSHIQHHYYPTDYLRATILFREKTWVDTFPESYFVSEALGGVTVYDKTIPWDSGEAPMLSLLIAGRNATGLARERDERVLEFVLEVLPAKLGVDRKSVVAFEIDRWLNDLGVSRMPGGVPLLSLEERHMPAREHPGLFILGDFLYDTTVNGALDGAKFVVSLVCSKVCGTKSETLTGFPGKHNLADGSPGGPDGLCEVGTTLPFVKQIRQYSKEA